MKARLQTLISLTLLSYFSFIFSLSLYAQDEGGAFRRTSFLTKNTVVQSSPESSNFGRYGDFSLSDPYTGQIGIQVPLYSPSSKILSMGLRLQYDHSGNKPANLPGLAGLGWTLTGGIGSISRSMVGRPDLDANYFSKADSILHAAAYTNKFEEYNFLYALLRNEIEGTPDNYYANFPGASTKFYISPDESILQKTIMDLKITPTFNTVGGPRKGDILSFEIRDAYGHIYDFEAAEETTLSIDDLKPNDPPAAPVVYTYTFNSSWFLTKWRDANSIESFEYDYINEDIGYDPIINNEASASKTYSYEQSGDDPTCNYCNEGVGTTTYGNPDQISIKKRKFLSKITYKLGSEVLETMEFFTSANPCTQKNNGDRKLDSIVVKRSNGTPILRYDFTYDCSTNRLTLLSVQERAYDGSVVKEPHQFEYNLVDLPAVITNALDHHAYYNGIANANLIPNVKPGCSGAIIGGGANRNPSEFYGKAGLLERLIHPTGAWTDFIYEGHKAAGKGVCSDYNFNADPNADRSVGGIRIEQVENRECDGTLLTKRNFKYVKESGGSSGLLLAEPDYLRFSTYTNHLRPHIGKNCSLENYVCNKSTVFASNQSSLGAFQGAHIAYSRIEEIVSSTQGDTTAGKTVYHYKNEKFGTQEYDKVTNGLLTKKEILNNQDQKVAEQTFVYSTDEGESRLKKSFFGYKPVAEIAQDNKVVLCELATGAYNWRLLTDDFSDCVNQFTYYSKYVRGDYKKYEQTWIYQSKMTDIRYFYNGNTLTGEVHTTTDYIYEDTSTTQATQSIVQNSDGKTYKSIKQFRNSYDINLYPATGDPTTFLAAMRVKNMFAYPLLEAQYIDNQLVYMTKLNYQQTSSGLTLPYKLYEQFPTTGDLLAEVFDKYDEVGNLWQGHRHYEHSSGESQSISMIYSHGNSRMSAQIKNAKFGEIAYTGFETNEIYQGGWNVPHYDTEIRFNNIARTGKGHYQSFNPSFTAEVISTIKDPGDYIVSYYTNAPMSTVVSGTDVTILSEKSNSDHPNNYTYKEYKIRLGSRTVVNVSVNYYVAIDELRLYPSDALMTTYAYDKDTRLPIAIMDENALPSKFEYDGLLRLTGVRNFDDHYVGLSEYLYKNQTNANNVIKSWAVLTAAQTSVSAVKSLLSGEVIKSAAYYDGLGRDQLNISEGTSAGGHDQISLHRYDEFGRKTKQYLPFTLAGNNGAYLSPSAALTAQQNFISTEYGVGNAGFGLVDTELESSPLNRVFKQRAPGNAFYDHPTETEYGAIGANQVRNFHGISTWYPADSLFKIVQKDENGNSVFTYTDKIGRKIMQDQQGSKTYFLYSNLGFLEQVIQPEAAQKGHDTPMLTYLDSQIRDGSFLYTYDDEHRMKTKVVPNCAAYTYFYDDLDNLVLTIDGNNFKSFIKYDKLGRVILTGQYKGSATPSTSQVVFEERNTTAPHYYTTNQSFPSDGNIDIYTVSYYDDYDLDGNNTEEITYESNANFSDTNYPYVRGLPTASKVAILNNDGSAPSTYLNAYTFYDQFRRAIHSRKENHLSGQDKVWSQYNFPGWLEKTSREHSTNILGQITNKTINERWEYDHVGRELAYHHEVVGDQVEKQICEMEYNERDELKTKKIGNTTGTNFLQTVDYAYNIRKWLTSINNPKSLGDDLFGMSINYTGFNANFNGNISKYYLENTVVTKLKKLMIIFTII